MNLKVQIPNHSSVSSICNLGRMPDFSKEALTFHAYSDTMKARMLESIAKGVDVRVSVTNETPRNGEWFESLT